MPASAIGEVVEVWRRETRDLCARPEVEHVLCFENKGEVVGVSNPHPHGQIYATNFVFRTVEVELAASIRHRDRTGRALFDDVIRAEQQDGRRILFEDERVIAFVPYFARYAYEVYVAPKRRVPHVFGLDDAEVASLAAALQDVTARFDNLWRISFPYVMALHQAPAKLRRRRRRCLPLLHRLSPAAAAAEPAQVSGGSRDRRRQLPGRHLSRGEGGGAAGRPGPPPRVVELIVTALRDVANVDRLLARIRAIHEAIRDRVVASCETRPGDELAEVVGDDAGDTLFAIDRVSEEVLLAEFEVLAEDWPMLLVAEGLGQDGRRVLPEGTRDPTTSRSSSSSIRSTARAASCTRSDPPGC